MKNTKKITNKESKKEQKKERPQKIKKYAFGDYLSRWSVQFWKEYFKYTFKKRSLFLIVMKLRNKKYDMFTVATDKKTFSYKSSTYVIDSDMAEQDTHTNLSMLYYHQDISIPFKIVFDIADLKKQLRDNAPEVDKAINPSSLKAFIHSEVIEKVMKGQELSNEMKFIKTITIINLCISVGTLLMIGRSLGWF